MDEVVRLSEKDIGTKFKMSKVGKGILQRGLKESVQKMVIMRGKIRR